MDFIILALVFLTFAVFSWAAVPDESRRMMRRRILSEVSDDKEVKRTSLLAVLATILGPLHKYMPLTVYMTRTTARVEEAGLKLPPLHFLVLQEMGVLASLMLYFVTVGMQKFNPMLMLLFGGMGFLVPSFWLGNCIKARRMTIQRDLPEVVDLLTLAVGAGSDFMSALGRIVREFRPCPVREELTIVLQEVGVGKRRRDAMRAFANRVKTPETSTFARTIIQVDRMGTGMAEALNILSEDMRMQRYNWAERYAQQAPMKMLIPLVLSLGAAMVVVAGPIFIRFFKGGLMEPPKMDAASAQQAGGGK